MDTDDVLRDLHKALEGLDTKRDDIDAQITRLQEQKKHLDQQRNQILTQIESLSSSQRGRGKSKKRTSIGFSTRQNDLNMVQFEGTFEWDNAVKQSLRNRFKLKKFRQFQKEIINCTLKRKDCFVLLPSGGGKSLCYQLPATLPLPYTNGGITLVVSPLVSLMIDQCYHLNQMGIKAGSLHGTDKSRAQNEEIYEDLKGIKSGEEPEYKLVYVTPEKVVRSKKLLNRLQIAYDNDKLERIVIDEAHCCSQWGHDFRPDFKKLNLLRRTFSGVPIIACTATATQEVLEDTKKILKMNRDTVVFRGSFNRPNLHYSVRPKPSTRKDALAEIARIIKEEFHEESGIVYAHKIKDSLEICSYLKAQGVSCLPYNGDMDHDLRDQTQTKWLEDRCQVVVATTAFGLGINKPDVSFVIHFTVSQSVQNYYQESGRAGRDGEESQCILLYKPADCFNHIAPMIATRSDPARLLRPIMEYAHSMACCRRHVMARAFNEEDIISPKVCKQRCDVCDGNDDEFEVRDITEHAMLINKIVERTAGPKATRKGEMLSLTQLVDIWRGSSSSAIGKRLIHEFQIQKMKTSDLSKAECEYVIGQLFVDHFLDLKIRYTAYQAICCLAPGQRAARVTEAFLNVNRGARVTVNLPVLGKRKREKLRKEKGKNAKIKKGKNSKRSLPALESTTTTTTMTPKPEPMSGSSAKIPKSEPVGMGRGHRLRKRKRAEMAQTPRSQMVDLCSDSDGDYHDKHSPLHKAKKRRLTSQSECGGEDSDLSEEPFKFDIDDEPKKTKKRKSKTKGSTSKKIKNEKKEKKEKKGKKRKREKTGKSKRKKKKSSRIKSEDESDDEEYIPNDDDGENERDGVNEGNGLSSIDFGEMFGSSEDEVMSTTTSDRKLRPRTRRKIITDHSTEEEEEEDIDDDIEDIEEESTHSMQVDTANFLDRYEESSFQFKLGTELMCWNEQRRGNMDDERYDARKAEAQMMSSTELIDVVNSMHCILDPGGEQEVRRIIGGAKWNKFGKVLMDQMKRCKEEYRLSSVGRDLNGTANAVDGVSESTSTQQVINTYNITNVYLSGPAVNTNNIGAPSINTITTSNVQRVSGNEDKRESAVKEPMQIAEKLRNKQKSLNLKGSSFRPATAFPNDGEGINVNPETDVLRTSWRRKSNQKSEKNRFFPADNNDNVENARSRAVHSNLLASTPILRNTDNMMNDTGFEYPDSDGDEVSTPQSEQSLSPPQSAMTL